MSSLVLSGDTSGSITIATPAVAGTNTLTLPTQTGTVLTGSGAIGVNASAPTSSLNIDSSGNVGIGTTSPTGKFNVVDTNGGFFFDGTNASYNRIKTTTTSAATGKALLISAQDVGTTPDLYINTSGNVLIGATSLPVAAASTKFYVAQSAADYSGTFYNTNATAANTYGVYVKYSAATPNGTGNSFLVCEDSTTSRFVARSNGGLANYSANNVNLSDERLKTDILPATTYLDKICSIPVVTFKYKDQLDNELNLGVIAQEVDKVAPELVDHSGFGETPEGESPYLAIYQTDLQYALMKCIQEQQTIINDLKARIETLESK